MKVMAARHRPARAQFAQGYNAALEKAKAAGDTTIEADPGFNAANLQGPLVEKQSREYEDKPMEY
ncbi:hypothetical protein ABEO75_23425 [Paenibacillus macerans]|uniref:hypothetical protein n=1 Tax=Paenibacillus macerans TaxID=44252 RepID=UPI003D2C720A